MENVAGVEYKKRATSSISSNNSVTEYVNEMFENSELELSKVICIEVSGNTQYNKNPLKGIVVNKENGYGKSGGDSQYSSDQAVSEDDPDRFLSRGFRKMYLASLTVLLFAVNMGVAATYSATATEDMTNSHSSVHPSKDDITWIGSLLAVGALIGGTAGGYFSNSLGRKGTLMFNTMPFVTGWLLIAYAESTALIFTGRILTGFATGIVSVATPMYLVEISTPEVRGLLGASFQLFVVIGVLIVTCLGSALTWKWLAVSGAVMCLIASFAMLPMPESPRWLMSKNRRGEAKNAIIFLQGESYDAEGECRKLEDEIKKQPAGGVSLKEFLVPTAYKPFILSIMLMFFQQFSGVNAVLFYTVDIFKSAKVLLPPITATLIVSVVQVFTTLLGSLLMDRAGRRPLLMASGACMALSLFVFGGYNFAKAENEAVVSSYGWLPVICLTAFIGAFSIGFGPTPWLMVAEMTPARFRSIVSGVATALNWTFAFIVTKSFKALITGIHDYGIYWYYGIICLISIIMTIWFLPETKGKKMSEIEEYFRHK